MSFYKLKNPKVPVHEIKEVRDGFAEALQTAMTDAVLHQKDPREALGYAAAIIAGESKLIGVEECLETVIDKLGHESWRAAFAWATMMDANAPAHRCNAELGAAIMVAGLYEMMRNDGLQVFLGYWGVQVDPDGRMVPFMQLDMAAIASNVEVV